jgi:GTPase SAR1 family protein
VFSVTNRPSFDLIRRLNTDIVNETGNPNIPRIIVGNKTDAGPRRVEQSEAIQLAKELGCDYVETSAKNNERIQETFMTLLDRIEADYGTAPLEKNQSTCIIA